MDRFSYFHSTFQEHESFLKTFQADPRKDKGRLFLEIDLPDNPGAEDALCEKLWRTLETSFFNCESDDPYFCFEEALKHVNQALEQENIKRGEATLGRIHAIAALLQGNALHFSQTGTAILYLKRGHHLNQISEENTEELEQSFSSISSGDLHEGDIVLFASRPLPVPSDTVLELFSEKFSKTTQQLKSLLKTKNYTGNFSLFPYEPSLKVEEVPEELEEDILEVQDSHPKAHEPAPVRATSRHFKIPAFIHHFKTRFPKEKVSEVKRMVKIVGENFFHKLFSLLKKPSGFQHINRRYILVTVVGLTILLGVLITVQSGFREKREQAQYYENLLAQVKNNISIAENRFLIGEKTDAVDFLKKAELALQEIEASNFFQNDTGKLKKEISLYRDNFDAIIRPENPVLFANLSEKTSVDALGLIHTKDEKNYIYEPRRLFETILDKVQEALEIDPEEIIISGAELEDFNVLSLLSQSGQIIEYSLRNGKFDRMKTLDEAWKKAVDIKTFNGEYVYLLDPSSNTIWKYRRLRNGYSKGAVYSSEGDLSNTVSIAIDGDIYALLKDGSIVRYRKGKVIPYEIKDQPSIPLKNPSRIFTLPESTNIYVLDSENKRVVAYSKGQNNIGSYQKQIIFDTLESKAIKDFYVDKDEQKLVILTADKMYLTDL